MNSPVFNGAAFNGAVVHGAAPPAVLTLREAVIAWLGTISGPVESVDSIREAVIAWLESL